HPRHGTGSDTYRIDTVHAVARLDHPHDPRFTRTWSTPAAACASTAGVVPVGSTRTDHGAVVPLATTRTWSPARVTSKYAGAPPDDDGTRVVPLNPSGRSNRRSVRPSAQSVSGRSSRAPNASTVPGRTYSGNDEKPCSS